MIIINADDWGRSHSDTNAALSCYESGRITSVSAMVFMEDSKRAADLAKDIGIDVGLHLNLSQPFTSNCDDKLLLKYHDQIVRFLTLSKYSMLIYNIGLRKQFRYVYQCQVEDFLRLYGKPPSHIDGHHHMHICANMLVDRIIPAGEKVRRNFSFRLGEKGLVNRTYRSMVDRWLARRYRLTDFFFSLPQFIQSERIASFTGLADESTIEIMVHPAKAGEYAYLMSDNHLAILSRHKSGTYSSL